MSVCVNTCKDPTLTTATSPPKPYAQWAEVLCLWLQHGCSAEAGCLDDLLWHKG